MHNPSTQATAVLELRIDTQLLELVRAAGEKAHRGISQQITYYIQLGLETEKNRKGTP